MSILTTYLYTNLAAENLKKEWRSVQYINPLELNGHYIIQFALTQELYIV
jgi:hypothetical protein